MAHIFKLPIPIMVFTSPKELRQLADDMEEQKKNAKLGDSCEVTVWRDGDDAYEIRILYNQGEE